MRLICPNCDAQYEVPDEVMPLDGRDVQCSNCGQTWFEHHPDRPPEAVDTDETPNPDEEVVSADAPEPEDPETVEQAPQPETVEVEAEVEPEAKIEEPDPEEEVEDDAEDAPDLSSIAPKRKELDPAVADILREEAELDRSIRQREPASPVESQPDLGLEEGSRSDDADRRAREAADRMARMRGEDPDAQDAAEAAAAAAALGSRRDLLPDIEEINSTLRSSNDRGSDDPAELANVEVRERRGFRRGFSLIILLVAALALLYVFAPTIIEAVPALEAAITSYVGLIDSLRGWLDLQMTSLLAWLDDAAAASANS